MCGRQLLYKIKQTWLPGDVEWGRELAVFYGRGQGRSTDRMVTEQKLEGKAGGMWIPGSKVFQVKGKGSVTPWDEAMFEVSEDREEGD